MLIALLVVLGANLIVIVAFLVFVFGRRRWLKNQPGEFAGAIRVTSGGIDGLKPNWKRGSGRWVRDVFVWTKAPLMVRNEILAVDKLSGERQANDGEVKRLGDKPVVIELTTADATVEVAVRREHLALAIGSFTAPSPASAGAP
jgi:hypothetical protein